MKPKLIIHGGSGRQEGTHASMKKYREALAPIVANTYKVLSRKGARAACFHGIRLLENEDIFNAGYGSKLQRDGAARMSASFMDGYTGKFSAVINVENVQHPVDIARILNNRKHTVLAGSPAEAFARKEDMKPFDPVTPHRLKEHRRKLRGETGTCGIVTLDSKLRICVATSTGGIGYEVPGRVGDSPTVAGNYANKFCGISCTGIGENIINLAVAATIAAKVEDGHSLNAVVDAIVQKGIERKYRFGLIAIDCFGNIITSQTRNVTVLAAWHDGNNVHLF